MRKKRWTVVLCAAAALLLAAGCGASSKNEAMEEIAMDMPAEGAMESAAAEEGPEAFGSTENGSGPQAAEGQKLIRTVNLEMETREFDADTESLVSKAHELGGYVESSSVWGSSYDYASTRSAEYTVRIPSARLNEFLSAAEAIGNIVYQNEQAEDVTLQYVDVESHKKALETEQERLLELLEKAESLEDVLTIEGRLSQVRYELENYGSQLRVLDNQVDYSTVYLRVEEVERISSTKEQGFFGEIASRFNDSLYQVGSGLRSFAVGFIGSLPILAVWALILGGMIALFRRIFYGRRPERLKKEKKPRFPKKQEEPETFEDPK